MTRIHSAPPIPTRHQIPGESQHTVQRGETLSSIAAHYGLTLKALQNANPKIASQRQLYPGDKLVIPEKNSSTVAEKKRDNPKRDVTAKYKKESKGSKSRLGQQTTGLDTTLTQFGLSNNGIDVGKRTTAETETRTSDPHGNTATNGSSVYQGVKIKGLDGKQVEVVVEKGAAAKGKVDLANGVGAWFSVHGDAVVSSKNRTDNGTTTFTSSVDVSVSIKGGVSIPQVAYEQGKTQGIKATYKVSMPEASAETSTLKSINPFDPSGMPEGTVIRMDGAHYSSTEFKATFKKLAMETKVTDEHGVSVAIEKFGPQMVRVTAGPTQVLKAYNAIGFEIGEIGIKLGRSDTIADATLKTAAFDLSTAAGRLGYREFLSSGTLPEKNSVGVRDTATIEKRDASSKSAVGLDLWLFEIGFDIGQNVGSSTKTTYGDGSSSRTIDLQYGDNVPLTITRKWDAAGNEIAQDRKYAFSLQLDSNGVTTLNPAVYGDRNKTLAPAGEGAAISLNFSETQMKALLQQTLRADQRLETGPVFRFAPRLTPEQFAVNLIRRNAAATDQGFAEMMHKISRYADGNPVDGFEKIGATVTPN